jgi:hypothetical protein
MWALPFTGGALCRRQDLVLVSRPDCIGGEPNDTAIQIEIDSNYSGPSDPERGIPCSGIVIESGITTTFCLEYAELGGQIVHDHDNDHDDDNDNPAHGNNDRDHVHRIDGHWATAPTGVVVIDIDPLRGARDGCVRFLSWAGLSRFPNISISLGCVRHIHNTKLTDRKSVV